MPAVTARRALPAPALAGGSGTWMPYDRGVADSKKYVVSRSFGFTPPVSVAVFWPALAAGPVVTPGFAGAAVAPAGTSMPSVISTAAKPVPRWILRRLMFPFRSWNRCSACSEHGRAGKGAVGSQVHRDQHD